MLHKAVITTLSICICLVFPASAEKWTAHWIWQSEDGPSNTWLCLRKKVTLPEKPTGAPTRIAAENNYWLYVNEQLVVQNGGLDVRPDLDNTYYDSLDISPWLQKGDNIIAVLVWYKGGINGYSQHMVNQGGFLFESDLSGVSPAKIVSDNTWKIRVHPSFEKTKQQTQGRNAWKWASYPVNYDARKSPGDWTSLSYNDEGWTAASNKGVPPAKPWNTLVHRTIPLWKNELVPYLNQSSIPSSIKGNTTIKGDVGVNVQGYAYLKLNAPAGVTVTIRMNQYYKAQYITREGEQEYTMYQWQNTAGRLWKQHCVEYAFTNVKGTVEIRDLKFMKSTYNTDFVGKFSCNNQRLNSLWEKCRNTSLVCMRDIFYDCPDRERGQWWGDVSEQILYSFYLFDERSSLLAKKGFRELMNTQKKDGSLYTTAPGSYFHLPDQNLAAVMTFYDYYLYTGDTALVRELYPKMKRFITDYVANTRNSDGMLIIQNKFSEGDYHKEPWNWIDWGTNLDVKVGSANTVVNGVFIKLMESMKSYAKVSGNTSDVSYYQGLQDEVKSHFDQYFWNSSENAYKFHDQSKVIDDRSNAWAVLAGIPGSDKQAGVLKILNSKQNASPYQERYIEDAMFVMGKDSDALTRMETYYKPDLDSWSTTMWERLRTGFGGTNNHAWAASPCYLLGAYVAGIKPTAPGFSSYQVLPMMGELTAVSAVVPSLKGSISVSDSLYSDRFTMDLVSPDATDAIVGIPKKKEWLSVTANGKVVWNNGNYKSGITGISEAGVDDRYIKFKVAPGTWRFTALLTPSAVDDFYDNGLKTSLRGKALLLTRNTEQCIVNVKTPGTYSVRIIDTKGRVYTEHSGIRTGQIILKRDMLAQGVYFVQLRYGMRNVIVKIMMY